MAMTRSVRVLLHELATPLTVLMSASDILHKRAPAVIQQPLDELRELSHQLGRDVVDLRANLDHRLDLCSAARTAEQLREWATGRAPLRIRLMRRLDEIRAASVRLPEPMLDRMLNQSLVSGANDLEQVWSRLAALQPEELESRP